MLINLVQIQVKADNISEFLRATEANHIGSRLEAGNLRFDVLQLAGDEGRFFLYEVFQDEAALEMHRQSSHYKTWRMAVEPWMESPRISQRLKPVYPADKNEW